MKIGFIVLAASLPLMASQATLDFTSNPNGIYSPYTGTFVNSSGVSSSINLYCDDGADTADLNKYNVQVDTIAQAAGTGGTGYDNGRFTAAASLSWNSGLSSAAPPNATDLYEELAWLFAQITTNSSQTTAIQDAAWDLTHASTNVEGTNPQTTAAANWLLLAVSSKGYLSDSFTGTTTLTNTSTSVSLASTNYSNWFVIDAQCTGSPNCTLPGTDSNGASWQEFLSYSNSPLGGGGGGSTTPEPATFGMLGGALLFGGLFARRKSAKK